MSEPPLPAWLTSKVDQRLALLEEHLPVPPDDKVIVMTPLTEPRPGATRRELNHWERTCDACDKFCRHEPFFTGHLTRHLKNGLTVAITFGVCEQHTF